MKRKQRPAMAWLATLLVLGSPAAASDQEAIKDVVNKAYVEGIHVQRDLAAVRAGFHPDFVMHVLSDKQLIKAPLDLWLERLQLDGTPNDKQIEAKFLAVDVTGDAATAKLEIYENGVLIYTDYSRLYRFERGWEIVNKLFQSH